MCGRCAGNVSGRPELRRLQGSAKDLKWDVELPALLVETRHRLAGGIDPNMVAVLDIIPLMKGLPPSTAVAIRAGEASAGLLASPLVWAALLSAVLLIKSKR